VSEPKTEKRRRVVALDPAVIAALRDHQGRQLLELAAMGGDWGNDLDLVFTREDGSPIHPQAFSEMFERHVKESKLPKLSLHGLRHTHATIALRAGVHPRLSANESDTPASRSRLTSTPTRCRTCRKPLPVSSRRSFWNRRFAIG
jgi:integrase